MILIHIGFGLMTIAAATAIVLNQRLRQLNKRLLGVLETASETLSDVVPALADLTTLSNTETFMEERKEPIPHFAVYRKGIVGKIVLLQIGYKPNDPDDREYKRIFAQERVDALNEKP